MIYLKISDLQIKKYKINQDFLQNQSVGIFSKDKGLVKIFLDIISGINKNKKTCFHNDIDIFDNKQYFSSRIYLDFSKKYLSTLRVKFIEERLKNKYGLDFNKEKFVKISNDLDVRGETEITYTYKFSQAGNTFVNYALLSSLEKPNIIINNPIYGLNISNDIKYVINGLTSKYNSCILGIDRLVEYKGKIDKLLLFTDFYDTIIVDKNDTFIVFNKDYQDLITNKIYQGEFIITYNNYTKEELRYFTKQKIEYKIISVFDIEKYL